jgi:hypothetical protein
LLEAQFDENFRFRQLFMEETKDLNDLRSKPIGKDKSGNVYWYFVDTNNIFRLFVESRNGDHDYDHDHYETKWRLIVK